MQVLAFRENGDTSNVERVFLYKDSGATAGTEGDPFTGLTFTSTDLNISTIANNEATPNTDTSAATSSVETIATLGTFATPTAGFVRFKEVDATNMPGLYELQWENARYAISNAIWLDITISGVADLAPFHGRVMLGAFPTAADVVDEWEAQSQSDPTGFHVNVQEWIDTAVTLGNSAPDVNIASTDDIDLSATQKASVNTEVDNSMVTYGLDHLISTSVADEVVDDSIIAKMVDAGSTADWSSFINSEDSLRAISEAVASIGSATGGGFNFAPVSDDVLEDLIDDSPAVDKSTTPATVGIPVTGAVTAGWLAGDECTIAGSVAYNGQHVIDSVTTNEVVIVSSFTSETFSSDTIKRTIKATRLVGVETTNTFAVVAAQDLVYHVIDDDGGDNFAISYRVQVGGGRRATEISFTGFLNPNNSTALIQAYDFVSSAWETRATFDGQNGSANQVHNATLLARNTGTSGVELGQVLIRLKQGATGTNPTLNVDTFLVEAVGIGQTAGYSNGAIYVDTTDGTVGTESFVNGTSDNPCKTWADAQTIAVALNMHDFRIINGTTITLDATIANYSLFGDNWTLALNGQSIAGCHFEGAIVSGTSSGTGSSFFGSKINNVTIAGPYILERCILAGTITLDATESEFEHCTMSGTPVLEFGNAVGNTTIHLHGYNGVITLSSMGDTGTDVLHIDGEGTMTTDTCAGGTVHYRGEWKITDSGGNTTFNPGDLRADVAATLVDTADIQPNYATSSALATVDSEVGVIDGIVDSILTDTAAMQPEIAKMVFTNANELDVNTKSINDAEVIGDGNATPWDGV